MLLTLALHSITVTNPTTVYGIFFLASDNLQNSLHNAGHYIVGHCFFSFEK